jgi:hypothetical protein
MLVGVEEVDWPLCGKTKKKSSNTSPGHEEASLTGSLSNEKAANHGYSPRPLALTLEDRCDQCCRWADTSPAGREMPIINLDRHRYGLSNAVSLLLDRPRTILCGEVQRADKSSTIAGKLRVISLMIPFDA